MLLILIRAVFVLVDRRPRSQAGQDRRRESTALANPYVVFIGVMIAAIVVVAGDLLTPRKRIQTDLRPLFRGDRRTSS